MEKVGMKPNKGGNSMRDTDFMKNILQQTTETVYVQDNKNLKFVQNIVGKYLCLIDRAFHDPVLFSCARQRNNYTKSVFDPELDPLDHIFDEMECREMVIDFSKRELEIQFHYIPGSIYQDAKFVKQLQSLFELYQMEYTLCGENRACIKYHNKEKYPHTLEEIEEGMVRIGHLAEKCAGDYEIHSLPYTEDLLTVFGITPYHYLIGNVPTVSCDGTNISVNIGVSAIEEVSNVLVDQQVQIEKELFEKHQITFHCEQDQNHYCTFQMTVPKVYKNEKRRRFWLPRKN